VSRAESAQVSKAKKSMLLDYGQGQAFRSHALKRTSAFNGLLGKANPLFLENAIRLLTELREDFEKRGFDKTKDLEILHAIYGSFVRGEDFPSEYVAWTILAGDPERCKKHSITPAQIRKEAIAGFAFEIERLSKLKDMIEAEESQLLACTLNAMVLPPPEVCSHLARHEAHLGRQISRTLEQLERLQCHRRGQLILPTIKVSPALSAVLRTLFEYIHSNPNDDRLAISDLTMALSRNPNVQRLNAHEVGRALTSLGFTDRKRTNAGFILWLDLATRERVHTLAHDHGIDQDPWFSGQGFAADCDLCKELADANRSSAELNQA
jgi:hypothetical protein